MQKRGENCRILQINTVTVLKIISVRSPSVQINNRLNLEIWRVLQKNSSASTKAKHIKKIVSSKYKWVVHICEIKYYLIYWTNKNPQSQTICYKWYQLDIVNYRNQRD